MLNRRVILGRGGAVIAALPLLASPAIAAPPKAPAAPTARIKRKAAVFTVTLAKGEMGYGVLPTDLVVGDTIMWVNDDLFVHTATARDTSFDVVLKVGSTGRTVLVWAGEIPFYCRFHPGMKGVLVVAA